jgi:hypothetical protein
MSGLLLEGQELGLGGDAAEVLADSAVGAKHARWHGTRIGSGSFATAEPAARTAFGLPAALATLG